MSSFTSLSLPPQSGLTPLHLAAQEDKVNVAEVLVNQGAAVDPETKVQTASHSAAEPCRLLPHVV